MNARNTIKASTSSWKRWAEAHPEKNAYYHSKEYHRKWRAAHKQAVIEASNNYQKRHPDRVVERKKTYKEKTRELKREVFKLLGCKCTRCGFDDPRALQIDHIKAVGDNRRRRQQRLSSYNGYLPILEAMRSGNPHNYQLLCANCNWIKRWENKEHIQGAGLILIT